MGYSFNSKGLKTDELLPYGLGFSGGRLAFAAGEQSGQTSLVQPCNTQHVLYQIFFTVSKFCKNILLPSYRRSIFL
uniref:Uncharacterized protein n=1 Tax=Oryza glaberrima TaxID=4538 RepID=I1P866_ORYGL